MTGSKAFSHDSPKAFVTMATTDPYAVGAAVLAASLRSVGTAYPLYCLVPSLSGPSSAHYRLSLQARQLLLSTLDGLIEVEAISSLEPGLLELMGRKDLECALTKLHVWRLDGGEQSRIKFIPNPNSRFAEAHEALLTRASAEGRAYLGYPGLNSDLDLSALSLIDAGTSQQPVRLDAVRWQDAPFKLQQAVYVDSDMFFVANVDGLLDENCFFGACPDIGWPDSFNSGLMVLQPSGSVYRDLIRLAATPGRSFDGADQGLLNEYYANWHLAPGPGGVPSVKPSRSSSLLRLPFIYNVAFSTTYTHAPAYRHYGAQIKGVHFLGHQNKPWHARPSKTASYQGASGWGNSGLPTPSKWVLPHGFPTEEAAPYLQAWWDLYGSSGVRGLVDSLGGLPLFGIFGGPVAYNPTCYSQEEQSNCRDVYAKSQGGFGGQVQQAYGAVADGSDGWHGRGRAGSPTQEQPQGVHFSNYRIHWNPQLEEYFNGPSVGAGGGPKKAVSVASVGGSGGGKVKAMVRPGLNGQYADDYLHSQPDLDHDQPASFTYPAFKRS